MSLLNRLAVVCTRLPRESLLRSLRPVVTHLDTQVRWKRNKAAKMGQHLETLDEMAHRKERQLAKERRKQKKQQATAVVDEDDEDGAGLEEEEDDEDDHDEPDEHVDENELPDIAVVKARMKAVVDKFQNSIKSIRGGQPTIEIFDGIQVKAYGELTPLNSVAQVVLTSSTLAQASCYDPSLAKEVSIAIRNTLELNPSVEEGGTVRIPLPRVSLEVREQAAKKLAKRTESYRQRIRKVRRNMMEPVKQGVAGKLEGISKDDAFRLQEEIESLTDTMIRELNAVADTKHKTIMTV